MKCYFPFTPSPLSFWLSFSFLSPNFSEWVLVWVSGCMYVLILLLLLLLVFLSPPSSPTPPTPPTISQPPVLLLSPLLLLLLLLLLFLLLLVLLLSPSPLPPPTPPAPTLTSSYSSSPHSPSLLQSRGTSATLPHKTRWWEVLHIRQTQVPNYQRTDWIPQTQWRWSSY